LDQYTITKVREKNKEKDIVATFTLKDQTSHILGMCVKNFSFSKI